MPHNHTTSSLAEVDPTHRLTDAIRTSPRPHGWNVPAAQRWIRVDDGAGGILLRLSDLMRTRAVRARNLTGGGDTVIQLCAHFETLGTCNRGYKCRFAHRVATHPLNGGAPASNAPRRPSSTVDAKPKAFVGASKETSPSSSPDGLVHVSAGGGGAPPTPCRARTSPRQVVRTSYGWRHAAYDARPI